MAAADTAEEYVVISLATQDPPTDDYPKRYLRLDRKQNTVSVGRASKIHAKGFVSSRQNGWFDSPVMSRAHAEIVADLDNQIRDLGSLHGTYINEDNDRLPEHLSRDLVNGDSIRFGVPITRNGESFCATHVKVGIEFGNITQPRAQHEGRSTFTVPDNSDVEDEENDERLTRGEDLDEAKTEALAEQENTEPLATEDLPKDPVECAIDTLALNTGEADHLQLETCVGAMSSHRSLPDLESSVSCQYDLDSIQLSVEDESLASDYDQDLELDYSSSERGLDQDDPDSVIWDDDPVERSSEDGVHDSSLENAGPPPAADEAPTTTIHQTSGDLPAETKHLSDLLAADPMDTGGIQLPPLLNPIGDPLLLGSVEISPDRDVQQRNKTSNTVHTKPATPPPGDKPTDNFTVPHPTGAPLPPWVGSPPQEFMNTAQNLADSNRYYFQSSAFDLQNKEKAVQASPDRDASQSRRTHVGIADIVESCPVEPVQKVKRKAADISDLSEAEKGWEDAQVAKKHAAIVTAEKPAFAPKIPTEPGASAGPSTASITYSSSTPRPSKSQVVSAKPAPQPVPMRDSAGTERQVKRRRLRHVAESIGYATLGGATVGAAILSALIYTAPTFS